MLLYLQAEFQLTVLILGPYDLFLSPPIMPDSGNHASGHGLSLTSIMLLQNISCPGHVTCQATCFPLGFSSIPYTTKEGHPSTVITT